MLISFIRKIRKPNYETLNKIQISSDNIVANFNLLKNLQPNSQIIPVLKSNAYGHGLKEICKIVNKLDVKMVAVDSFPEAQIVYRYFSGKVLIIGEMPLEAYLYCKPKRTEFCIYNSETLKFLADNFLKPKIHLFVNTGMNREGIKNLAVFLLENAEVLKKVEITGLCSHLASADSESPLNKKQEDKFIECLNILNNNQIYPDLVHLGNSAGAFILNNAKFNAFRCGIAFYGYNPFIETNPHYEAAVALKPALRILSHVVSLQNLEKGESVSYNETFISDEAMKIAVIPFGYHEGLPRNLSNKIHFKLINDSIDLQNIWTPSLGKICMNLSCLGANDNETKIGDLVEVVSCNKKDKNSLENLANLSNLITYEILINLDGRIRREVVE